MTDRVDLKEKTKDETAQKRQPVLFWVVCFILLGGFIALISAGYFKTSAGSINHGDWLPAFQLTTFDGEAVDTKKTDTVILVNFWASWCQPCQDEAAALEQAWKKYEPGGKVIFLGVDYMDTETQALRYLAANPASYPNGPDAGGRVSSAFRVRGVPETYIFDRNGLLVYSLKGPFKSADEIIKIIDPLLARD
jgi:cytochrome c biogenesis protein CcmG, thiol:disulfide interchange protein DsbE